MQQIPLSLSQAIEFFGILLELNKSSFDSEAFSLSHGGFFENCLYIDKNSINVNSKQ